MKLDSFDGGEDVEHGGTGTVHVSITSVALDDFCSERYRLIEHSLPDNI